MHEVRSVKKIMPVCTSLFIPLVIDEKPQRIFENLQGSLKICKDLQKTIEDKDLQKTSEDLHLVKVGVKILMGAVRIL